MQREPRLHRIVVVRGIERAGLARGAQRTLRTVDFMRQPELLPRHDTGRLRERDQGTGTLGQGRVRGEERFDGVRAGRPEPPDPGPPLAPARNAYRQIRERPNAVGMQRPHGARCEPQRDVVGHLRLWYGQRSKRPDCALDRACPCVSLRGRMLEDGRQIGPMPAMRKGDQLPADVADEPARGNAGRPAPAQVAGHGGARGQARIPAAQGGKRVGIGETLPGGLLGLTRFHGANFSYMKLMTR